MKVGTDPARRPRVSRVERSRHRSPLRVLIALLLLPGCRAADPRLEFEVTDVETYWAIDSPTGQTQFVAPVVRFQLRNKGGNPHRAVSATATFTRKGETQAWSSAYRQVSPPGKPFGAGETRTIVLKPEGEGRYSSPDAPESILQNPQFKDVHVQVFLRLGPGAWAKVIEADIERRIGARGEAAKAFSSWHSLGSERRG